MGGNSVVPVAVQGFTWAAAGSWSVFVLVLGAIGLAVNRAGPAMTKLVEIIISRGDKLRAEKREEEVSDAAQITALNDRMTRMSGAFVFLANAVTVSVNGLASDDRRIRDDSASHARELVAMAVSTLGNEDPFTKALDRLAAVPPVSRGID